MGTKQDISLRTYILFSFVYWKVQWNKTVQLSKYNLKSLRSYIVLTQLGIEKTNDIAKSTYFSGSNQWDAPVDILTHNYRLYYLQAFDT